MQFRIPQPPDDFSKGERLIENFWASGEKPRFEREMESAGCKHHEFQYMEENPGRPDIVDQVY